MREPGQEQHRPEHEVPAGNWWRIGELAASVHVSAFNLRSWEKRYALFSPRRADNGYREYSELDHARAEAMRDRVEAGEKAGDAARAVLLALPEGSAATTAPSVDCGRVGEQVAQLCRALTALDEPTARDLLIGWAHESSVETVLAEVGVGTVRELGARWLDGRVTAAQGQFSFQLLRHTLVRLAVTQPETSSATVWLACPARDAHDLILLIAGLLLQRRGYRVRFFGANTPLADLRRQAVVDRPDLVVLSSARARIFDANRRELSRLAAVVPVALAGEGADSEIPVEVGAVGLTGDVLAGTRQIADLLERAGER